MKLHSIELGTLLVGLAMTMTGAACSSGASATGDTDGGASTKTDAGKKAGTDAGNATTPIGDDSSDDSGVEIDAGGTSGDDAGNDTDAGQADADTDASPVSTDGGGTTTSEGGTTACAPSGLKASQVVMIGDSYLDDNWSFTGAMIMDNARKAGKLAQTDSYRHYYVGGTQMVGGLIPPTIPQQYENAKAADKDIKVVIMDGGGNDILIGNRDCLTNPPPANASCVATIKGVIDQANKSLAEMATDGVKAIVYMFYAHLDPAGGGLLPMPAPGVNPTLDYAEPLAAATCSPTGAVPCYFVSNTHIWDDQWSVLLKGDHIHPLPAGAQILADRVWKTMEDHCIAQ